MGKLPAILLSILAAWLLWDAYHEGAHHAFGGLIDLLDEPQYGQADRPTHSGELADEVLREAEDRPPDSSPPSR